MDEVFDSGDINKVLKMTTLHSTQYLSMHAALAHIVRTTNFFMFYLYLTGLKPVQTACIVWRPCWLCDYVSVVSVFIIFFLGHFPQKAIALLSNDIIWFAK